MTRSRESAGSSAKKRADRPFDGAVWKKAVRLAREYRLILEPKKRGGYLASAVEFPTVLAEGRTPDECVESAKQALAVAAATMIESGRQPPTPASRRTRRLQINIRVSADEKFILEETAARLGFKGTSDFVRTAALERSSAA